MASIIAVALVVGGAVLLFAGAALSVYGVGLLGVLLGGGVGYIVAPTIGSAVNVDGMLAVGVGVLVGAIAGMLVTYALLSMAIAAVGFGIGIVFGLNVVAPALGSPWYVEFLAALAVGVVVAGAGMFLTKTTMILISSFIGAALVSRSLTMSDFTAAQEMLRPDPLVFELVAPVFPALFVLGVLSQLGLFKLGYVTRLVGILPGALIFRDRGRGDDGAAGG
jgi:hypothetical protein